MTDWMKANKMYLLIGILVVTALGIYYFFPLQKDNLVNNTNTDWEKSETASANEQNVIETEGKTNISEPIERILVDVKGAVTSPGVYEVNSGERVIDVINKAGGLLESADKNQINFAQRVADEMVLYIPATGEQRQSPLAASVEGTSSPVSADGNKVNLNTASETDLQTLPGIGPAKATAIIEYREGNGPFKKIEDLMEISGIGDKTFEKLKESIVVK
jgi:competence protein ComEA